jgi:hypothetical protein
MKRWYLILLVVLLLVACDLPAPTTTPTGTPGADSTETPTATLSPSLSATSTATATSTTTPTATPGELVYSERIDNGGFEDGFDLWLAYGGFVGIYWYPVIWREWPIPRICEAGQTVGCNPPGLTTRNPEYKPGGGDPFRTLAGNSQQWFSPGQHSFAGIAQDVDTTAGDSCIVSAWAQTWGAAGGRSNVSNELYRSDYATQDDRDNMHMLVVVNPDGDGIEFPFPDTYLVQDFGYADGIYDEPTGGAVIGLNFTATGSETTVAFIGYQVFPVGNANWYIDEVSVWCYGPPPPPPVVDLTSTPTPEVPSTPGPTSTPAPTYIPTPDPITRPTNADENVVQLAGNFFPAIIFATFGDHFIDWGNTVRESIPAGNPIPVVALYKDPFTGELWFTSDGHWQQHDVWDVSIWVASEWYPWYANLSEWAGGTGVDMRWFGYFVGDDIPDLPYSLGE